MFGMSNLSLRFNINAKSNGVHHTGRNGRSLSEGTKTSHILIGWLSQKSITARSKLLNNIHSKITRVMINCNKNRLGCQKEPLKNVWSAQSDC